MLFELFHELVQQLAEDGGSGGSPSSPLQLLPQLASQIARLAAGGGAVGLAGGWLTRRLLRVLRWYGASSSQVGGCPARGCVCARWGRGRLPPQQGCLAGPRCALWDAMPSCCPSPACWPPQRLRVPCTALQEVAAIVAVGYLAFYIANAPMRVSGARSAVEHLSSQAC